MNWQGKRYWIIGASEGLGRAIAQELSSCGAELVVSARTLDRLQDLCTQLPSKSIALQLDVSDANSVSDATKSVGKLDGIIYTAGAYYPMSAQQWDTREVDIMNEVNFAGALRVLGSVLPDFISRDKGHVVLIGSLAGFRGLPNSVGYGASKAALMHLGQSLYADLRKTNIKVQVINPGFIETRLTKKNDFAMPFMMTAEKAAERTIRYMAKSGFEYSFPKRFASFFYMAQFLPNFLYYRFFR